MRAAHAKELAEAIADFVQARRVRREVISICEQWLEKNSSAKGLDDERYWVLATLAEAFVGLDEESLGQQKLEEAFAAAPEEWMKQSTQDQLEKLKTLLASSPLKKLPAE